MFVNPYTCPCSVCRDYIGAPRVPETDETPEAEAEAEAETETQTQESAPSLAILSAIGEASHADQREQLTRLEDRYDELWARAGGGTLRSPSTGATSTTYYLGEMQQEIDARRQDLGLPNRFRVEQAPETPSLTRAATGCGAWGCTTSNCTAPEVTPALSSPPALSRFTILPPPPRIQRVNAFADVLGRSRFGPVYEDIDEDDLMDQLRSYRSQLQLKQDDLYRGLETEAEIQAMHDVHEEMSRKIYAIEQCMLAFGAIFRTR